MPLPHEGLPNFRIAPSISSSFSRATFNAKSYESFAPSKNSITENTVAIVAIAGTTELGLIDPIEAISKIAKEHDIYLHVDAAFGGFSIPFLKLTGYDFPKFDFELESISAMETGIQAARDGTKGITVPRNALWKVKTAWLMMI